MAIDYSKRKSYQKIVSKAKSYDPRGKQSLRSQRQRMQRRRKILTPVLKDPNLGTKNIRALVDDPNPMGKLMKMYNEKKGSATSLLRAFERMDLDNETRGAIMGIRKAFSSIKTDKELMREMLSAQKKGDRLARSNRKNRSLLYAGTLIGP